MTFSRRTLLLGGIAVFGVGVGASAAISARAPHNAVEAIIRRIFGSDLIPDTEVERFASAYLKHAGAASLGHGIVGVAVAASYPLTARALGLAPIARVLDPIGSPYENAETAIATFVIKASNFMFRGPGETLEYTGLPDIAPFSCVNPLARFDDAD